jgi:hypothetical protein
MWTPTFATGLFLATEITKHNQSCMQAISLEIACHPYLIKVTVIYTVHKQSTAST